MTTKLVKLKQKHTGLNMAMSTANRKQEITTTGQVTFTNSKLGATQEISLISTITLIVKRTKKNESTSSIKKRLTTNRSSKRETV